MPPQTMIQKALASAANVPVVEPGETVVCDVERAIITDSAFADANFVRATSVHRPERLAVVLDHGVPAPSVRDAESAVRARAFVDEFRVQRFFDVGRHGICHQIIAEHALALPGELMICPDSHTAAAGALNVAARGLGGPEIWQVVCHGTTWFTVPKTVRYDLEGTMPGFANGKDVFLAIAGQFGSSLNHAIEFGGNGVANVPMSDRRTIAAQCVELGAEFALFPHDDVLEGYLSGLTREPYRPVTTDDGATFSDRRRIDLNRLVPYVALPDGVAKNVVPVDELDLEHIDQCFIGSCANGQIEDLEVAARILRGRRVDDRTRLIVTPASQSVYLEAARRGYLEVFAEAGASVTTPTCGACFGYHMGVLAAGEVCLTASTRNFRGRMGSPDARIYMAAPGVVAASAVRGRLTDPREYLN